jgi:endogenous inhibitor of DNA gyrase (YacG/DUF329 family)
MEENPMELTTDCPNCGARITSKRWNEQDWFLCDSCQSIFLSHENLRKNWRSLYGKLKSKDSDLEAVS